MPSAATMIQGHSSAGESLIAADLRPTSGIPQAQVGRESGGCGASRIAIGIRGTVAALQPDLVRPMSFRPGHEEFRVERKPAIRVGVELHHPAVETALVELRIDRAVERVGEIDASAVAADFDHLRSATELAVLRA